MDIVFLKKKKKKKKKEQTNEQIQKERRKTNMNYSNIRPVCMYRSKHECVNRKRAQY